jgi:polyphosphate kinase 2 (PPK2 family)
MAKVTEPEQLSKRDDEKELAWLQTELVRLQDWIVHEGLNVVVVFEGRDTALSGMDLEARRRRVDYAEAKDEMFAYTDTRESPWYVVEGDDKRTMRRQKHAYVRPPQQSQNYVPRRYMVA